MDGDRNYEVIREPHPNVRSSLRAIKFKLIRKGYKRIFAIINQTYIRNG